MDIKKETPEIPERPYYEPNIEDYSLLNFALNKRIHLRLLRAVSTSMRDFYGKIEKIQGSLVLFRETKEKGSGKDKIEKILSTHIFHIKDIYDVEIIEEN